MNHEDILVERGSNSSAGASAVYLLHRSFSPPCSAEEIDKQGLIPYATQTGCSTHSVLQPFVFS